MDVNQVICTRKVTGSMFESWNSFRNESISCAILFSNAIQNRQVRSNHGSLHLCSKTYIGCRNLDDLLPQACALTLSLLTAQDHNEVFFKIKRSTQLKKLMDAYCERQGKATSSVRFLYDGIRIQPTK